jgi:hypothetical protein
VTTDRTGEAVAETAASDQASEATIHVGVVVAHSPGADPDALGSLADRATRDALAPVEAATGLSWSFHESDAFRIPDREARRPSDFLDEASLRMAEGRYDAVVVVTDATLVSRHQRPVPGLASELARVAVVSTQRLRLGPRDRPVRDLDDAAVRWNAAALLLHLVGHVLGLGHGDGAMEPFRFDPDRRSAPGFDDVDRDHLRRRASAIPERHTEDRGVLRRVAFHLRWAARHPGQVLRPLARNRAPLLALSLPKLATAAVAPTLVLVFSAETWDVGVHLTDLAAAGFAAASILAATGYLTGVQDLLFPREDRAALTEHTALVNVAVVLTVFAAIAGLFAMVGVLVLAIEVFVFPPDLITNWPTLENPQVGYADLVRTAAFVSTVGVVTGALAGGLESRTVLRHLALFRDRP